MSLLKGKCYNPGDKSVISNEPKIKDISFNIFNFSDRNLDKPKVIISCFSEFGCESLGLMYQIPRLRRSFSGCRLIAAGWYGRAYLYKHLVDEYWEMKEEFQWLRDYCRAFHHQSQNLLKLEHCLNKQCKYYISTRNLGSMAVGAECNACKNSWYSVNYENNCPKCGAVDIRQSLFGDVDEWKKTAIPIPTPSREKMEIAKTYLKPNSIGVFARGRKTYGRNLSKEFYIELISFLENMGYNIIWLGEKQSTLPCPVNHIVDFSRMDESRDLELTLAIIKQLQFTLQYWTASTRLASMMGVPYILFESPDQIWGQGQEGYRRQLCDLGPSKLIASHFLEVKENPEKSFEVLKQAIEELKQKNYNDMMGLLVEEKTVISLRKKYLERINGYIRTDT